MPHTTTSHAAFEGIRSLAGSEQARCHACAFKIRCLPAELTGDALDEFEGSVVRQTRPVKAGQVLVRQGEPMHTLFALRVGSLKAVIRTPDGADQIIGFRFPGSVVGLAELEGQVWERTLVALEDAWVCRIPTAAIDATLRRQLLKLMSERLRREYNYHFALAFKSSAEKLALFLLDMSETRRQWHFTAERFTLPMNNLELANYLGMRHESLSRTFAKLERWGLLEKSGKHVHLRSVAELEKLAGRMPIRRTAAA